MSNVVTKIAKKTVKKTARKATRSATKGAVNYVKGSIVRGFIFMALAFVVANLKSFGIPLPEQFTDYGTLMSAAFILCGIFAFGRGVSAGRGISFIATLLK